jgi:hypothetical protein
MGVATFLDRMYGLPLCLIQNKAFLQPAQRPHMVVAQFLHRDILWYLHLSITAHNLGGE